MTMKTTRNEGWSDATEIGAQREKTRSDATEIGAQREKTRSDATVNATLRQKVRISATEIGLRRGFLNTNYHELTTNLSLMIINGQLNGNYMFKINTNSHELVMN